jgi:hypothetical protein
MSIYYFGPNTGVRPRPKSGIFDFAIVSWAAGITAEVMVTLNFFPPDEARARVPVVDNGYLPSLRVSLVENTMDGPCVVTVYVNGAPTTLSVTVPAGTSGYYTSFDRVDVSAGDLVSVYVDTSGATAGGAGLGGTVEYYLS